MHFHLRTAINWYADGKQARTEEKKQWSRCDVMCGVAMLARGSHWRKLSRVWLAREHSRLPVNHSVHVNHSCGNGHLSKRVTIGCHSLASPFRLLWVPEMHSRISRKSDARCPRCGPTFGGHSTLEQQGLNPDDQCAVLPSAVSMMIRRGLHTCKHRRAPPRPKV